MLPPAQGRLHLFAHTRDQPLLAKYVPACVLHQLLHPMSLPMARKRIVPAMHWMQLSSQVEGYRNKAEFTIGPNAEERPAVGFLFGAFKVWLWGVGMGA